MWYYYSECAGTNRW